MEEKKYLNEEKYQKSAKTLKTIGRIVLVIGIIAMVVGIVFIILGVTGLGNMAVNNTETTKGVLGGMGMFALGGFLNVFGLSLVGGGAIVLVIAHRKEIMAFTAQQTIPVAKEVAEDVAPTIGKVGSEITKQMAPAYGEVAKEIAKGIKEGQNESDNEE